MASNVQTFIDLAEQEHRNGNFDNVIGILNMCKASFPPHDYLRLSNHLQCLFERTRLSTTDNFLNNQTAISAHDQNLLNIKKRTSLGQINSEVQSDKPNSNRCQEVERTIDDDSAKDVENACLESADIKTNENHGNTALEKEMLYLSFVMRAKILLMGTDVWTTNAKFTNKIAATKSEIEKYTKRAKDAYYSCQYQDTDDNLTKAEKLYDEINLFNTKRRTRLEKINSEVHTDKPNSTRCQEVERTIDVDNVCLESADIKANENPNAKEKLQDAGYTEALEKIMLYLSFIMRAKILIMGTDVWTTKAKFTNEIAATKSEIEKYTKRAKDAYYSCQYQDTDDNLTKAEKLYDEINVIFSPILVESNTQRNERDIAINMQEPISKQDMNNIEDENFTFTIYRAKQVVRDKEETDKCIGRAEAEIEKGRLLNEAERLLNEAERLCPTIRAKDLLRQVEAAKGPEWNEEQERKESRQSHQQQNQDRQQEKPKRNEPTPEQLETIERVKGGRNDDEILVPVESNTQTQTNERDIAASYVKHKVTVRGDELDVMKCIQLAEDCLSKGNIKRAERLLLKAERICPTKNARQLLKKVEAAKLAAAAETATEAQKEKSKKYVKEAGEFYSKGDLDTAENLLVEANNIYFTKKIQDFLEKIRHEKAMKEAKEFQSKLKLKPEVLKPSVRAEDLYSKTTTAKETKETEPRKVTTENLIINMQEPISKQDMNYIEVENVSFATYRAKQVIWDKEEAAKCIGRAEAEIEKGRLGKAERLLKKAERLWPLIRAKDLLRQVEAAKGPEWNEERERKESRQSRQQQNQDRQQEEPKRNEPTPEQLEAVKLVKRGRNDYEILGLEKECTTASVTKAYRRLTLLLHPDKNKAPGAKEAFMRVSEAVQRLKRKNRNKYLNEKKN